MRKRGVSGILRVKNDAEFIEKSIDSCIDALDELIIVYNDCTDDSPMLIEKKRRQYPDKIRVYEYPYRIYSIDITKEEYEYALSLPQDSPHLLSSYYNFALSKVSFSHAMKIDADQIYFSGYLKSLCDFCRQGCLPARNFTYWLGWMFNRIFSAYRWVCIKTQRRFPFLPASLLRAFRHSYVVYSKYQFFQGKACFSLSGLNVFKDSEWYVSLAKINPVINILPPYNGENDHLLFKVDESTYYRPLNLQYYNKLRSSKYSLIEEFVHPYKCMFMGFCWFHLNSMRNNCRGRVKQAKGQYPHSFMSIRDFIDAPFNAIDARTDKNLFTLYQRVLFSYIHTTCIRSVKAFIQILDDIKVYDSSR